MVSGAVGSGRCGRRALRAASACASRRCAWPTPRTRPLMDPCSTPSSARWPDVRFAEPRITFVSNLTGKPAGLDASAAPRTGGDTCASRCASRRVCRRWTSSASRTSSRSDRTPCCSGMGAALRGAGRGHLAAVAAPRPRRLGRDPRRALQTLYAAGADVDWAGFDAGCAAPVRRAADLSVPAQAALGRLGQRGRRAAPNDSARVLVGGRRGRSNRRPSAARSASTSAATSASGRASNASRSRMRPTRSARRGPLRDGGRTRHGRGRARSASAPPKATVTCSRVGSQRLADAGQLRARRRRARERRAAAASRISTALLGRAPNRSSPTTSRCSTTSATAATLLLDVLQRRAKARWRRCSRAARSSSPTACTERSATMRYINGLAAAPWRPCRDPRASAPLRVLEIGAGTGGTTAALLPLSCRPDAPATATPTCRRSSSIGRAKTFAAARFVDFAELDIERDLDAQGVARRRLRPRDRRQRGAREPRPARGAASACASCSRPAACCCWWSRPAPRVVRHHHRPDRGLAALRRRPAHATTRCCRRRRGCAALARRWLRRCRRLAARGFGRPQAIGQHVVVARVSAGEAGIGCRSPASLQAQEPRARQCDGEDFCRRASRCATRTDP